MMTATSTEHRMESSWAFLNRPPLRFRNVLDRGSAYASHRPEQRAGYSHGAVPVVLNGLDLNLPATHGGQYQMATRIKRGGRDGRAGSGLRAMTEDGNKRRWYREVAARRWTRLSFRADAPRAKLVGDGGRASAASGYMFSLRGKTGCDPLSQTA